MNKEEIIKALRDMARYPTVTLPRDSEALKAAADLLAQPEQEPVAWQPIETAPEETEIFIGRFIDGEFKFGRSEMFYGRIIDGEFKFGRSEMFYEQANEFEGETFSGWAWSEDDCSSSIVENPTHWMALPEAPIEAKLKQKNGYAEEKNT